MNYQFAEFIIDTCQFQILVGDELIPVEPKVFDLLIYLIENRHRLVTRDELFEQVWGGRQVLDSTLSNHIKSARKALKDSGEQQSVIKTLRGRGYQFVAPISEITDDKAARSQHRNQPANINQAADIKASSRHQKSKASPFSAIPLKTVASLMICICLGLGWYVYKSMPEVDSRPYILVVPFEVSGENQANLQAFAEQTSRELIRNLRKISGLRVVPPPSAFTFKEDKRRSFIRSQLPQVSYVLDAVISVGEQNDIRITAELENLQNGELLWDGTYQSNLNDTNFFAVQAEIASSVSASLQVLVLEDEQRALGDIPTDNLLAYERYIEGRHQLDLFTPDSLRRSITLFSEAAALDPTFTEAYIAKADAYRIIMSYYEIPRDMLPEVTSAIAEALERNPESAEARSSLGIAYVLAWRWQDAWNMLNEARLRDPDLALTELGFALYYTGIGDIDGVHRSLSRANQLDPLNTELADWGQWAYAMSNETEDALRWGQNKLRLHPDIGLLYSGTSVVSSLLNKHDEAITLAIKGVELESRSPISVITLAQAYGYAGQIDKVRPLLAEVEQYQGYTCPYETAVTYLLLGEIDIAFNYLNQAVTYRSNCLIFTRNDPRLAPIRSDPRYAALLSRVGLDDESIRSYAR